MENPQQPSTSTFYNAIFTLSYTSKFIEQENCGWSHFVANYILYPLGLIILRHLVFEIRNSEKM